MSHCFYTLLAVAPTEQPPKTEDPVQTVFYFAAAITAAIFAYMMLRRTRTRLALSKFKSSRSVKEKVADHIPTTNIMYRQMGELMADLADMARQVNGQIDTRIAKLEYVIATADKKLEQLDEATKRFNAQMAFQDNHTESADNTPAPPKAQNNPAPKPYSPPEPVKKRKETSPEVLSVLELADEGKTAVEIAQTLSRPTGEIELILALNKK